MEASDRLYMQRCLDLAAIHLGFTYPNPLVGAVIVSEGRIIAEGAHRKAGTPHAEVVAIKSVLDKALLRKSTLYVNLEPCNHYGRTPPCTELIIKHQIPRVVIGTLDPNPLVSGRGVKKLSENGIEVVSGILKDECEALNARFFTFQRKGRPYIILKWAESKDGFMDAPQGVRQPSQPFVISNKYSRRLSHKWRTEEQSILVGTNTAINDNPQLTARDWPGRQPVRLLIDRDMKTPKGAHIFNTAAPTIVFSEKPSLGWPSSVRVEKIDFSRAAVPQILDVLRRENIQSLLVEGGQKTLRYFIEADLWDEARVFSANWLLWKGLEAPRHTSWRAGKVVRIGEDRLLYFRNRQNQD